MKILLAEDNVVNQKVALKILEKMGYAADIVETGRQAVQRLEEKPYDLVLMDVEMPEMDGIEATRTIRGQESSVLNHDVYIIAMTAHAMKQDMERCLEAGMNDYVTKPIQKKELKEAIERCGNRVNERPSEETRKEGHGLPVFDRELLVEQTGVDDEFIAEIIKVFMKDFGKHLDVLEDAVIKGDASRVHHHAHTMKGACANICAIALREAAHEMEKAGKSGDLSNAGHQLKNIKKEFSILEETLSTT